MTKLILPGRKSLISASSAILAAPYIGHLADYAYNANTLTGLIPDLYAALDIVSRELVGAIPAVYRNASAERAALLENVTYPIVPETTASDTTPAMAPPTPADQTIGTGQMAITKSRHAKFAVNGEEQRGLANNGLGYDPIRADQIAQAFRVLTNEVEADLNVAAAAGASRAWGTGGTTPFATDLSDSAQVRKMLDDNGAPLSGRYSVINTTAGAKMRSLGQLTKANEAGTIMTLRQGELLDLHGISFRESAQVVNFTKGTGAAATTNNAGYSIGARVITLASAGTGEIKAGDVITFAGDTNKYVVASGDADVSGGGTITLQKPGLRVAIPAANTAITVGNSYAANWAATQNAVHLIARLPALPKEGDLAIDRMTMTDPRSGLVFEVAVYPGFRMVAYFLFLAWGVKAVKPEHIVLLLG